MSSSTSESSSDAGSIVADFLGEISSSDDDDDCEEWTIDWNLACKALRETGVAIIDNATRPAVARRYRDEIEALHQAWLLGPSPNGLATTEDGKGRAILNKRGVSELDWHLKARPVVSTPGHVAARKLCPHLRQFAGGAARLVARSLGRSLKVSLFVDEVKTQVQDAHGACFPAHFDTSPTSVRAITAILYLNTNWKPGDGGELRFLPLGCAPVDIEPLFNRLVLFSSTTILHRTLPCHAPRRCLSFWLGTDRIDSLGSVLPLPAPCTHCFSSQECDLLLRLANENLETARALTQLYHRYEYRDSFLAAFDHVSDLHAALALDDTKATTALSSLPSRARDILLLPLRQKGAKKQDNDPHFQIDEKRRCSCLHSAFSKIKEEKRKPPVVSHQQYL